MTKERYAKNFARFVELTSGSGRPRPVLLLGAPRGASSFDFPGFNVNKLPNKASLRASP